MTKLSSVKTLEITKGQRNVLKDILEGATLYKVSGMGSWSSPRCYLFGGRVKGRGYKNRKVVRMSTFDSLQHRGYIVRSGGDDWMTSYYTLSKKGKAVVLMGRK